ncbi:hypothetical protein ACFL2V_06495 [Pseudomonadota bacterium]
MAESIFFAQIFGPFYVVASLGILFNSKRVTKAAQDIMHSDALMYVSGLIALLLGLFIISIHNVWVADWPVIITIIGWAAAVKGTIMMVLPGAMAKFTKKSLKETFYMVGGLIGLVVGVYLSVMGYLA